MVFRLILILVAVILIAQAANLVIKVLMPILPALITILAVAGAITVAVYMFRNRQY